MDACPNSKLEKEQGKQDCPLIVGILTHHIILEMYSKIALGHP